VSRSPYWRVFVRQFDGAQVLHVTATDLGRLIDEMEATEQENDRLRQALSAAQTEVRRIEQQLARLAT
jgi:signal transduction protein with GAF and PtsI domain